MIRQLRRNRALLSQILAKPQKIFPVIGKTSFLCPTSHHFVMSKPDSTTQNLSQFIIHEIKKKLSLHEDITSVLSQLLHLSKSAIYRKINGDVSLSLPEATLLARHYQISLDNFILGGSTATGFRFRGQPAPEETDVSYYLKIIEALHFLKKDNQEYEMVITTQEITPFQFLYFPELAAFQSLLWSRVTMRYKNVEDDNFIVEQKAQDGQLRLIAKELTTMYENIPCTEFISSRILDKNLDALQHFARQPVFSDPATPILICEQLEALIKHLFNIAKMGQKTPFLAGNEVSAPPVPFTLFHDNFPNYDTNLLFKSPRRSFVYCSFDYPNFMSSTSPKMVEYVEKWIANCRTHSTRISGEGEMYRNQLQQFFLDKIATVKKQLIHQ